MPQPIPFPLEARRITTIPNISTPVKFVEVKPLSRFPRTLTASDHLDVLDRMLSCAVAKGGVLHPQEVLHMRQSVEALRKIEDGRHAEELRSGNHD